MTEIASPQEQLLLQVLDPAEDRSVRARAAIALTEFPLDRFTMSWVVPGLQEVCDVEQDTVVRNAARLALERITAEFDESAAVRRQVVDSFARHVSFERQDVPLLRRMLGDADAAVRKATVGVVTAVFKNTPHTVVEGMEAVVEALAECLTDADVEIRREAAAAFDGIRWALIDDQQRLDGDPSLVRRLYYLPFVIEAFHRYAMPYLTVARKDADGRIRRTVDDVLANVPDDQPRRDLVANLIRAAADDDVSVRYEAVVALGRVLQQCDGEEIGRIVFALLTIGSKDPSEDVRLEAVRGLMVARRRL